MFHVKHFYSRVASKFPDSYRRSAVEYCMRQAEECCLISRTGEWCLWHDFFWCEGLNFLHFACII